MRGKKTDFSDSQCSIARAIGLVGEPWSLLIVRDALRGTRRFSEFQRSLGMAKNILSDRLRKLVAAGVLDMHPSAEGSTRNEYLVTDKGRQLAIVLAALATWGGNHAFAADEAAPVLVDRRDGLPVRIVALAEDGRELEPADTKLTTPGAPA
ncbi:MAG: helix-turn-helix domain-containing protein [Burkholderia gladioli]